MVAPDRADVGFADEDVVGGSVVVGVLELSILDVDDVDDAVVDDIRVATAVAIIPSKAVATIKRG